MRRFPNDGPEANRIQIEDELKHLLDCDESGLGSTVESLAGALARTRLHAAEILGHLKARG